MFAIWITSTNLQRLNLLAWMRQRKPNTESPSWYFPSFQHLTHPCTKSTDLHDLPDKKVKALINSSKLSAFFCIKSSSSSSFLMKSKPSGLRVQSSERKKHKRKKFQSRVFKYLNWPIKCIDVQENETSPSRICINQWEFHNSRNVLIAGALGD